LPEAVPAAELQRRALDELMEGYQGGDQTAAGQLVERLSPLLFRFLWGPGLTRGGVEDLLQDCWLRIHKARHTFRRGEPLLPWAFAIARHVRVDGYRRSSRITTHELATDRLADYPVASPAGPELDLPRLLDTLPEGQREVLFLLKVSGMSLEEVARATSSTVGAVKQKAHRGYEKLRETLGVSRP